MRCTSEEDAKHKRGPKCLTCPMMANESSFTINNINCNSCHGGDCKSYNLIHLLMCRKCGKPYIGKTTQPLHKRVNGHRTAKIEPGQTKETLTDDQALAAHCLFDHKNEVEFNKLYKIFIIKVVNPNELLSTEQFLANKYKSFEPTGLNIGNPIGLPMLRTQGHNR